MRLLFDQNLSHHLVAALADLYPGATHVRSHALARGDDGPIWQFAMENGFAIVSKDSDFHQRSFLYGFPPKVIWIRTGNCSTAQIEEILRNHRGDIERFAAHEEAAFLEID